MLVFDELVDILVNLGENSTLFIALHLTKLGVSVLMFDVSEFYL